MNRFTPTPAQVGPKPFTWSYSALKNFETCPHKHLEVDKLKNFGDTSPALEDGNRFHMAMKKAVSSIEPLPAEYKKFQPWVEKLTKDSHPLQIILTEQKLAITKDHNPTGFFGRDVWFRGVVDFIKLIPVDDGNRQIALAVDYKTGQPKDDSVQLALFAALIFAHYPDTVAVRTDYMWTQDDTTTREDFTKRDMLQLWTILNPRIAALEVAHITQTYPAVKGGLCKNYCPVTSCAFNGRYNG